MKKIKLLLGVISLLLLTSCQNSGGYKRYDNCDWYYVEQTGQLDITYNEYTYDPQTYEQTLLLTKNWRLGMKECWVVYLDKSSSSLRNSFYEYRSQQDNTNYYRFVIYINFGK